jgi:hypothetical protein
MSGSARVPPGSAGAPSAVVLLLLFCNRCGDDVHHAHLFNQPSRITLAKFCHCHVCVRDTVDKLLLICSSAGAKYSGAALLGNSINRA